MCVHACVCVHVSVSDNVASNVFMYKGGGGQHLPHHLYLYIQLFIMSIYHQNSSFHGNK